MAGVAELSREALEEAAPPPHHRFRAAHTPHIGPAPASHRSGPTRAADEGGRDSPGCAGSSPPPRGNGQVERAGVARLHPRRGGAPPPELSGGRVAEAPARDLGGAARCAPRSRAPPDAWIVVPAALDRPTMADQITLCESCRKVARTRPVRLPPQTRNTCRQVSRSGSPESAKIGELRVDVGDCSDKLGQTLTILGPHRSMLAKFGSPSCGRIMDELAMARPRDAFVSRNAFGLAEPALAPLVMIRHVGAQRGIGAYVGRPFVCFMFLRWHAVMALGSPRSCCCCQQFRGSHQWSGRNDTTARSSERTATKRQHFEVRLGRSRGLIACVGP